MTVRAHLGSCLVAAGKLDEGERLLLKALPLLPLVDPGGEVVAALRSLVELYTARGELAHAQYDAGWMGVHDEDVDTPGPR